ncbi:hypothetical protein HQQ94_14830 [Shewanella sp. VB17]|uniref:hypothetical protein n=1 Tax=Shewanella sp. VB17 TaxID=2739432 RepID=UPI00156390DE|nr:hypothetical protein [Shewanella sp. VB17]NRD74487.1 hypothetical protein [Shewanella sp. VB17]
MTKKWVFNALVQSNNDPIGLLAYALYKFRKDEIAKALGNKGKSGPEIAKRLENFHDDTLCSQTALDDFRSKAIRMANLIGETLSKETIEEYQNKSTILEQDRKQLEKEQNEFNKILSKEQTKLKNELLDKFKTVVNDTPKKSNTRKCIDWIAGGFSGIVAQIIVLVFTFGVLSIYTGSSEKLAKSFAQGIVSSMTASPAFVTTK